MYVPTQFSETRVPVLHDWIGRIGLGTLVTLGEGGLVASHVPMLVDPEPAPFGTLTGHFARANPQWRSIGPDLEALAVFIGPEAYISPAWYPTKRQTGKVVPTWNYIAIHAYGLLEFFDDSDRLHALVTRLTARHEAGRAEPWAVGDAPADFIRAQLEGIIGFALPIARIEGKWKMSQNRPEADRTGVAEGLRRDGKNAAAALVARSGADR